MEIDCIWNQADSSFSLLSPPIPNEGRRDHFHIACAAWRKSSHEERREKERKTWAMCVWIIASYMHVGR